LGCLTPRRSIAVGWAGMQFAVPGTVRAVDVFDDLVAEQDRLETILVALDTATWESESGAPGWTIADVVLHLAQTEEDVVATVSAADDADDGGRWRLRDEPLDGAVERRVRTERAGPKEVFERWQAARQAAVAALRSADRDRRLRWAAPLKPTTLATTRLAEHWAHGLDLATPLGIDFPDTDRLRHIAWLGHATLPYASALAGETPGEVFCELLAPDGTMWHFAQPTAASTIRGPAGQFCRLGARRLRPEDTTLIGDGPCAGTRSPCSATTPAELGLT
jgi:uncharacterized protein (TIGR03084 family)